MQRREFNGAMAGVLGAATMAVWHQAHALSLGDLTNAEASQGLKTALDRGASAAVNLLGRPDGFLGNPLVRIALPGFLHDAAKLMRAMGRGQQIDELETSMNRAAEQAVPLARDLLTSAVKSMSVTDAKNILTGGDTSVTSFFADKTREPLSARFLPVVSQSVEKVGLAKQYDRVAGKASGFGLMKKEDSDIRRYVTRKSLDGLYLMIGEEEKKIRQNPIGTGSAVLGRVFGAMK